jgi:hypothetical protein
MGLSQAVQRLRDQFVKALLDAAVPLQQGPDREVSLEALIEAAAVLRQRFEQELAELRQEETD